MSAAARRLFQTGKTKIWWAALLLPALALALLIYKAAVNTPFWDEWELVPIFQHLHAGHFLWHDFWQQHNEHRLFFPTLILVGLAYITHWNLIIESFASLAVACGSFWLLVKMVRRQPETTLASAGLLLLLGLIWFSPVQLENWLWGWQLEWFMNVFGVMLVAYNIFCIRARNLPLINFVLLLAGGILAQYSLGNGTLIWPIIIIALLYRRLPAPKVLLAAATGAAATILYYVHYNVSAGEPSKTLAVHQPLHFVEYVAGYLGRPLSFYHKPALAAGVALVGAFVFWGMYLFTKQRAAFDRNLVWFFLGLYAIGSALITGLARLGYGVGEAFSSRYTTISSLLLVSVIVLCWNNRDVLRTLSRSLYKTFWLLAVAGMFCAVLIEGVWGVQGMHTEHKQRLAVQQCTHLQAPTTACLLSTYPNATIVASRLQYVKSIHWADY